MSKITFSDSCGNSPKAEFLKQMNAVFVEEKYDLFSEYLADDIHWIIFGDRETHSLEEMKEFIKEDAGMEMLELVVENVITHGNLASANGIMKMENNKDFAFCDFYKFDGFGPEAKIIEMKSYIVEVTG